MLIRLTTKPGTVGKLRGASVLRIERHAEGSDPWPGNKDRGAAVTIRDERGWLHELHLTAGECAMLARDLGETR